jgi:hypothetical protein
LKKEVIRSSETSVHTGVWRYIPEDGNITIRFATWKFPEVFGTGDIGEMGQMTL